MIIDRLGGINPLENLQSAPKPQKATGAERGDSVDVSAEARSLSEIRLAMGAAKAVPDTRADRVAEVSEKIKDPGYITSAIIDIVADRFLDEIGL